MQERPNSDRLALIAHVIVARTRPDDLGATKLNKVLWWVDCAAYRRWGRSLTGLTHYERQEFDPRPEGMWRAISELKRAGKIAEELAPTPGFPRREFMSLAEPELDLLSPTEVDLIHQILMEVVRMSAREASDRSHDAYWKEQPLGARMSVGAGALWPQEPSEEAVSWGREEMRRLGLS